MVSKIVLDLHNNIDDDDYTGVKKCIDELPVNEIHAYMNDQSAVGYALRMFRPEIYKLLLLNGFRLGSHEDFYVIMNGDGKELTGKRKHHKNKIFEIHQNCAFESKDNYVMRLWEKCKLHHETPNEKRREFFNEIMTALKKINEIEQLSVFLQILALCPQLTIIFDFSQESVHAINPNKSKNVLGSTHPDSSCIIIGAKLLLKKEYCYEVYGTIAHEFCHFTLNFVFENNCKPYKENDEEAKTKFTSIVEDYSKRKITEEIVQLAFQKDSKIHSELIVRIPHLMVLFKGYEEKIQQLRIDFKELFDFFELNLLPKLIDRLYLMKIELRIEEINKMCQVSRNLQKSIFTLRTQSVENFKLDLESEKPKNFVSNCIDLTLKMIGEKLKTMEKQTFAIFIKFGTIRNSTTLKK